MTIRLQKPVEPDPPASAYRPVSPPPEEPSLAAVLGMLADAKFMPSEMRDRLDRAALKAAVQEAQGNK